MWRCGDESFIVINQELSLVYYRPNNLPGSPEINSMDLVHVTPFDPHAMFSSITEKLCLYWFSGFPTVVARRYLQSPLNLKRLPSNVL